MSLKPKVGDKILTVEILELVGSNIVVRLSYAEILRVESNNWEARILNVITLKNSYKLKCIEKYFENREFNCPLKFSSPIFCYSYLTKEDNLFIDAIFNIPEENRVWKEIRNRNPSQMIQFLKPYLLSRLGRK
jgi:hypothetical protein